MTQAPPFAEQILHVDMDAFYVEVERLRDPTLRGRPVVVGGLGPRGVVASASYEARRHGVRSAMPTSHARRLCPQVVVLGADHHRYREVSAAVLALLRAFTPRVEAISLDEAFLDVAGLRLHFPDVVAVGAAVRRRLRQELGLPASVGVARTKFLAKLASEVAKPDGLLRVPVDRELEFLHPLSVRSLWGVGEATQAALEGLGVRTVGDLAAVPGQTLVGRLGRAAGVLLHDLAWAREDRPVEVGGSPKSVSVERTFERDLADLRSMERELLALCDRLADRLRRAGLAGSVLTLKVRYAGFTTVTRTLTLPAPTDLARHIYRVAEEPLGRLCTARRVRLLGVGLAGLVERDGPRQLSLESAWDEVAEAVDRVRRRFGDEAIVPARLLEAEEVRP